MTYSEPSEAEMQAVNRRLNKIIVFWQLFILLLCAITGMWWLEIVNGVLLLSVVVASKFR